MLDTIFGGEPVPAERDSVSRHLSFRDLRAVREACRLALRLSRGWRMGDIWDMARANVEPGRLAHWLSCLGRQSDVLARAGSTGVPFFAYDFALAAAACRWAALAAAKQVGNGAAAAAGLAGEFSDFALDALGAARRCDGLARWQEAHEEHEDMLEAQEAADGGEFDDDTEYGEGWSKPACACPDCQRDARLWAQQVRQGPQGARPQGGPATATAMPPGNGTGEPPQAGGGGGKGGGKKAGKPTAPWPGHWSRDDIAGMLRTARYVCSIGDREPAPDDEHVARAYLGSDISDLRDERGWSQAELARRAGVSAASASRAEGGKRVNAPIIESILDALGVPWRPQTPRPAQGQGGPKGGQAKPPQGPKDAKGGPKGGKGGKGRKRRK
jgi:hypothetical protein